MYGQLATSCCVHSSLALKAAQMLAGAAQNETR